MVDPRQNDAESRELRGLVERIKRGDCVLVLGPRVAVRADDPQRRPLEELLADELIASAGAEPVTSADAPANLRQAADLHYRLRKDREELELTVQDFYQNEAGATTPLHRDLAELPFRLCISASPDDLMVTAFEEAGKKPVRGVYNFNRPSSPRLPSPSAEQPLVYSLFGQYEDPSSLVLTEADLIQFIVSIVRGVPAVPDQVRSLVADPGVSFLFLGFGFHNWYLRVLLQVMNVYGHRSKAIAFEGEEFFDNPEHQQTVGFFSGERTIDFRPLRWEVFAKQLRDVYGAGAPRKAAPAAAPPPNAPKAFLSYASEDRDAVEALAENLEERGIRVWQDKQNLRAGDNWNHVLFDVIGGKVDYVVVVQTPAMTTRIEGVFHQEIEAAKHRQAKMGEGRFRFLIPVQMGRCGLLPSLQALHVIDVSDANGLNALVSSIDEDWKQRMTLIAGQAVA
ncbi:MAG TPA: toll/interleukin-1 receptor domain-containing protein [Thermoanaerobaculia bacterium]|jgi:hypothetical protein|nr:toll/interleukin-1 receptor domain-containing protein [Thermoanaerobaculia bacterium]